MDTDLEARIRTRAYHLWENDPSRDDNAEKHWEEARRQIEAEGAMTSEEPPPASDQFAERGRSAPADADTQLESADAASTDAASAARPARKTRQRQAG
jgi:hypothetical protein